MRLTKPEIRTIIESLNYSIQRIKDYPHPELAMKELSLKPLLEIKSKLQTENKKVNK